MITFEEYNLLESYIGQRKFSNSFRKKSWIKNR